MSDQFARLDIFGGHQILAVIENTDNLGPHIKVRMDKGYLMEIAMVTWPDTDEGWKECADQLRALDMKVLFGEMIDLYNGVYP